MMKSVKAIFELRLTVKKASIILIQNIHKYVLNSPMTKRGDSSAPTSFSSYCREGEKLLFQAKFLAVGSSLGHLFVKKFYRSNPPS